MSELKPDVKQMLYIGDGCGLTYVEEAYNNYMNHYDCFFLIEKYHEQKRQFFLDMAIMGLLELCENDTKMQIVDSKITEWL